MLCVAIRGRLLTALTACKNIGAHGGDIREQNNQSASHLRIKAHHGAHGALAEGPRRLMDPMGLHVPPLVKTCVPKM